MSSRGLIKRTPSPLLPLSCCLLTIACYTGGDAGGGPIDLGTASTSPTSSSTDPPTTSLPTTSATSSTSTTSPSDTTSSIGTSAGDLETDSEPYTSSSGTTAVIPSGTCGDGVLDPGEQCDQGAAQNSDQGACTIECMLAKCGDQLIWAGQEACDNGDNNNDTLYGGCTTQCTYGPRCGDGELQGPEECDLGPDNGTGEFPPSSVPCTNACRFEAKLVFLSSVVYTGGALGGAKGAHEQCQFLAGQAGFDNAANFKAWVSDALFTPSNKDNGFTHTTIPYVRPDGVRIAENWDDLIVNGPDVGILVTEKGVAMPSKGVWTGTAPNGGLTPDTLTCQGWGSSKAADKGHAGLSGVDMQWVEVKHWTSFSTFNCLTEFPIYCFEQ